MLLAYCSLLSVWFARPRGLGCPLQLIFASLTKSPHRAPKPSRAGFGPAEALLSLTSSVHPKPEARGTLHRRFGERSEYEPGECAPSLRRQVCEKSARTHNSRSSGMGCPMRRFGERSEYEPQRAAHTARSCERHRTINKEFKRQKAQQYPPPLG